FHADLRNPPGNGTVHAGRSFDHPDEGRSDHRGLSQDIAADRGFPVHPGPKKTGGSPELQTALSPISQPRSWSAHAGPAGESTISHGDPIKWMLDFKITYPADN